MAGSLLCSVLIDVLCGGSIKPCTSLCSRSSREILQYVMSQCESFFIVYLYNVVGDDAH